MGELVQMVAVPMFVILILFMCVQIGLLHARVMMLEAIIARAMLRAKAEAVTPHPPDTAVS